MEKQENKNKKQERVAVYIDGSNFYYKLRDLNIAGIPILITMAFPVG